MRPWNEKGQEKVLAQTIFHSQLHIPGELLLSIALFRFCS